MNEFAIAHRPPPARLRPLAVGLGLALLAGLAQLPGWPGSFHFDDYHSLVDNPALAQASVHDLFSDPSLFSGLGVPMYRPLAFWSLAAQLRDRRPAPAPLFLVNLLLHAANTGAAFLLVWRLTRSLGKSAFAAGLFGLHPLSTQAVNYLSCRSTLLAALFTLAALAALFAALPKKGASRAFLFILSLGLLALGLLAKEEAVIAPLLVVLVVWLRWSELSLSRRSAAAAVLGFAAMAGLYLLVRSQVGVSVVLPARPLRPIPANLVTGLRADLQYLGLFLWPRGLAVIHEFKASTAFYDPRALLPVAVLAAALGLAFRARKERPLYLLGLGWFLVGLFPTTTLAPLRNPLAEHHVYLSLFGLCLMAAEGAAALREKLRAPAGPGARTARLAATIALLLILASATALTVLRCRQWRAELTLWRSAAAVSPGASAPWVNLGVAFWESGRVGASRTAFERALSLDPQSPEARTNLGRIYVDEGKVTEGIKLLESVRELAPREPELNYNLARAYAASGQYRLAELAYLEALRAMPAHLAACEGLASLYVHHLRDREKAKAVMARCLALKPSPEEVVRIQSLLQELTKPEPGEAPAPGGSAENPGAPVPP